MGVLQLLSVIHSEYFYNKLTIHIISLNWCELLQRNDALCILIRSRNTCH